MYVTDITFVEGFMDFVGEYLSPTRLARGRAGSATAGSAGAQQRSELVNTCALAQWACCQTIRRSLQASGSLGVGAIAPYRGLQAEQPCAHRRLVSVGIVPL